MQVVSAREQLWLPQVPQYRTILRAAEIRVRLAAAGPERHRPRVSPCFCGECEKEYLCPGCMQWRGFCRGGDFEDLNPACDWCWYRVGVEEGWLTPLAAALPQDRT